MVKPLIDDVHCSLELPGDDVLAVGSVLWLYFVSGRTIWVYTATFAIGGLTLTLLIAHLIRRKRRRLRTIPEYKRHLSELSIDAIKKSLEFVEQVDLKTARIDDLKMILSDLLRAYGCFAVSIRGGESIYRARRHRAEEKERWLDRVERIYPDPKYIGLGRANRESTAVFYFSADPVIALHECKAVAGDVFTVLECKPKGEQGPLLVPVGIHDFLRKHNKQIGGGFPETAVRVSQLFEYDETNLGKYELIDKFVKREFLKVVNAGNEHEFKLTIAIAEFLFAFETDKGPIDGIAYPSIASNMLNANVALRPDAFHRLYEPIRCVCQEVDGTKSGLGFTVAEKVAKRVTEEGTIQW